MIKIRLAEIKDLDRLDELDWHIDRGVIKKNIQDSMIYVLTDEDIIVGWLRYGLIFDMIPLVNLLYFIDDYRRKGLGLKLVCYWEEEMNKAGYNMVFISTQSDEDSQHFLRKIGYTDMGGLLIPDQLPLELVLYKRL